MNITKFHPTPHAKARSAERGISVDQMKLVVNYGAKQRQPWPGTHGGVVYKFEKAERGKTIIPVVAEVLNGTCWIITGYKK